MGQSWDRKLAGTISDAIPNELSKTNSFSKYLSYIPVYGTAAKAIWNGFSGVDRFGETYSNGGNLGDSLSYGASSFQDTAGDPNKYSPKNDSFANADGWLKAGKVGEALPGGKTDGGSIGRTGSLVGGIANNTNTHQSEMGPGSPGYNSNSFDMSGLGGSLVGGGMSQTQQPSGRYIPPDRDHELIRRHAISLAEVLGMMNTMGSIQQNTPRAPQAITSGMSPNGSITIGQGNQYGL